ncbi:hypothetical protein E2C01_077737 [Portunus trituberculatus]|uniref:Uncharacterized protein n=1 Tax=Portunus trituberculatus TaxID=210409 RepID=A0A5B7IMU5_PORTR|nr:hypothetical protein [Portunus trituberculatus]
MKCEARAWNIEAEIECDGYEVVPVVSSLGLSGQVRPLPGVSSSKGAKESVSHKESREMDGDGGDRPREEKPVVKETIPRKEKGG